MSRIEPPQLNLPTKVVYGIEVPVLEKPYTQILRATEDGMELAMDTIHGTPFPDLSGGFCGAVHCIAGATLHLCGAQGKALEGEHAGRAISSARMILIASSTLPVPGFFPGDYLSREELEAETRQTYSAEVLAIANARALEAIRERAAQEAIP